MHTDSYLMHAVITRSLSFLQEQPFRHPTGISGSLSTGNGSRPKLNASKKQEEERDKGDSQIPQRTFICVKIWRHGHVQPKGFLKKLQRFYNYIINSRAEGRKSERITMVSKIVVVHGTYLFYW